MKTTVDRKVAIMTIHAGTGGVEAQDFAQMLLRMYGRWAKRAGIDAVVVSLDEGAQAGVKEAVLRFAGGGTLLAGEAGIHRLQRVSPFGGGERHTSFCLVEVALEEDEAGPVVIRDADVRMDFLRGSGPGGQARNKVCSGVRLVHTPSGCTATITGSRSQWENRQVARTVLAARVAAHGSRGPSRAEQGQAAGWGQQVRTYTLNPRQVVKDHRTGVRTGDAKGVLDGAIEGFLGAA